jgi:hypothetical protein
MSRKTAVVTLEDGGIQKKFLITRMSAADTEDWALELFFALANSGIEIPDDIVEMGFAGVTQIGLSSLGKISYEKAKPLLARMIDCVQFIPNPDDERVVRNLIDEDIDEVTTRFKLRKEVVSLHTDFLKTVKT